MATIPLDLMEGAKRLAEDLPVNWNADTPIASISGAIIIAGAMLAERERCALMVEKSKLSSVKGETAKKLAEKIRGGEEAVWTEFVPNQNIIRPRRASIFVRARARTNLVISRVIGKRSTSMIRRRLGKE